MRNKSTWEGVREGRRAEVKGGVREGRKKGEERRQLIDKEGKKEGRKPCWLSGREGNGGSV